MIKTKINVLLNTANSALPAAMLFLILFIPLLAENLPKSSTFGPKVLGEQTSIRGEPAQQDQRPVPVKTQEIDLSPVTAQSLLVYDKETGILMLSKEPDSILGIASLTKLLTALVVYSNIDLNSYFTVNNQDLLNISPSLNLKVGDSIKGLDLLNSMLIGSCNDAALMLANHTSEVTGKNFEELMNTKAQSLGMINSHFNNPMGFDSVGNYSTASDLRLLVEATQELAIFTVEGRQKTYAFTSALGNAYRTNTTNRLIAEDPEITSIKTGFTNQTGGSMITAATHDGHTVITIILGSKNREVDTKYLKEKIFEAYTWRAPEKPQ